MAYTVGEETEDELLPKLTLEGTPPLLAWTSFLGMGRT